jgi:hypothetical protein
MKMYHLFKISRLMGEKNLLYTTTGTEGSNRKHPMKRLILILMAFAPFPLLAQVSDDFSDGNFTENPKWSGDTIRFEVNSSGQLHLKTTGADTAILSVQNSLAGNTEWDFWVKLSFNTSANNFARIYLSSDQADLSGVLSGYYLQIGGANDSISFFLQTNGEHTLLFRAKTTFTGNSVNAIRVKIIHDAGGIWTLYSDNSGGQNFSEEGSCLDTTITQSVATGVFCRFTSSNSSKFYFDDFYVGPIIVDTLAPGISSVSIVSENELLVGFSEAIDPEEAEIPSNYHIRAYGSPLSAKIDSLDHRIIHLLFAQPFPPEFCDTLFANNISDIHGNTAEPLFFLFCLHDVKSFDIVIREIMADPSPQTGLPDAEYTELYNRSVYPVSLKDWTFEAGTTIKVLPDVIINPHEFLILTKGTLLSFFGHSVDLFTSASTLSNEGSVLVLRNQKGRVIHSVNYSIDWYRNSQKDDGGWSLEMIDPGNPCGCEENWSASESLLGGTPGQINSINHSNPDTLAPYPVKALVENDSYLRVFFSEPLDSTSFGNPGQWVPDHPELPVTGVIPVPPDYRQILLQLSGKAEPGALYNLLLPESVQDCSGNRLKKGSSVQFAVPDTIVESDLVINELLSNPYPDGERFVELYNRSSKSFDLRQLVLLDPDTASPESPKPVSITEKGYMMFPGDYVVLTKDPRDISSRYYTPDKDCIVKITSLPGLTQDDSGMLILARKNDLRVIDRVSYSSDMNFPLLASPEGVSIERINSEVSSGVRSNWHSAAGSCGYATPGYLNSQASREIEAGSFVSLDKEIFSPDNDGKDDVVFLRIRPDQPGYVANIAIYSSGGGLIRQLVRNVSVSADCVFSWDGITDQNTRAATGIYVVYTELFNADGDVKKFKLPVVLASEF